MAWSIPIKTTINGISGVISINGGTGISIGTTSSTITITNSGVTSLQGNTGALSLSGSNGISISGLTISLTGVTSGTINNYNYNTNIGSGSYFSFTVETGGTGKVNFWGIMTASGNNAGYWWCSNGTMFELANVGGYISENAGSAYNTSASGGGNFFFGTISGAANTVYTIRIINSSGGTIEVYGYFATYMGI